MKEKKDWKYILRLVLNVLLPLSGWILLCLLGPWLLKFFLPFVIGWIIASIANPPVRFLERRLKLVRRHSSILVVVTVLAAVMGMLYLLFSKTVGLISSLIHSLPGIWEDFQAQAHQSITNPSGLFAFLPEDIRSSWSQLGDHLGSAVGPLLQQAASPTVEAAGTVARSLPAVLVYTVVIVLSSYFFIVDRDKILNLMRRYSPSWASGYFIYLKRDVKRLIGGYFLAQFKIMFVVGLILLAGFWILGISYGPLLALGIALLDFLPVFGTGTVLIPWALIRIISGDYAFGVGLGLLYVLTQVVRQLVQPKLVGDTMGLNPLLTLFLLYLGFKISGISGMILAVPVGLLVMSLYQYGAFRVMSSSFQELVKEIQNFCKNTDDLESKDHESGK